MLEMIIKYLINKNFDQTPPLPIPSPSPCCCLLPTARPTYSCPAHPMYVLFTVRPRRPAPLAFTVRPTAPFRPFYCSTDRAAVRPFTVRPSRWRLHLPALLLNQCQPIISICCIMVQRCRAVPPPLRSSPSAPNHRCSVFTSGRRRRQTSAG